jgi:hypothetical protein
VQVGGRCDGPRDLGDPKPTKEELLAVGNEALAVGRWGDARAAFEAALAREETAQACFGLAAASWWLGENHRAEAAAYAVGVLGPSAPRLGTPDSVGQDETGNGAAAPCSPNRAARIIVP